MRKHYFLGRFGVKFRLTRVHSIFKVHTLVFEFIIVQNVLFSFVFVCFLLGKTYFVDIFEIQNFRIFSLFRIFEPSRRFKILLQDSIFSLSTFVRWFVLSRNMPFLVRSEWFEFFGSFHIGSFQSGI